METHLYPHAIWIQSAGVFYNFADPTNSTNFMDPLRLQIGDIVAFEEEYVPILYSAALETAVSPWIGASCKRRIFGPGKDFGYLVVEPPVPGSGYSIRKHSTGSTTSWASISLALAARSGIDNTVSYNRMPAQGMLPIHRG
ncbi:MAG: hypothetical protein Q9198_011131, partial [Flavoplaca austrocitrina]